MKNNSKARRSKTLSIRSPAAAHFPALLRDIKSRIQQAQTRAILSVNAELVRLYWDIGRLIHSRQKQQGWGTAVIPRLAAELQNDLPEEKGFSERNIGRMIAFFRAYPNPSEFLPQAVAKSSYPSILPQHAAKLSTHPILPQPVAKSRSTPKVPQPVPQLPIHDDSILWSIPWGHHAFLLDKVPELPDRIWYMHQTLSHGWSRNILLSMILSSAHRRTGKSLSNFSRLLPPPQSDLIQQTLKDPYIFDFLTLAEPFHERELESSLLLQLQRFLLELGQGFAFVGRQFRISACNRDFSIDLLFYHLKLRRYVVIDLKTGEFKPEFTGKMNFYLALVDDTLRHPQDAESIGMILCQQKDHIIAEYALRGTTKPIGISEYELTRALPPSLQSALPTVEQIEAQLAPVPKPSSTRTSRRKKTPSRQHRK